MGVFPDFAEDPELLHNIASGMRHGRRPGDSVALLLVDRDADVWDLLSTIRVPSWVNSQIQEVHLAVVQLRALLVERELGVQPNVG